MGRVRNKRRAFIPTSLRPDVVGERVSITVNNPWKELQDLISDLKIDDIKNLAYRRRVMAKILGNPEMISNSNNKSLIEFIQNTFVTNNPS